MNLLKATGTIGGLTLLSRVLGLLRDSLFARYVGAGFASDAFLVAFRLPNMFRALFAEGAFASAFIPLFNQKVADPEGRGLADGLTFAEQALAVLLPVLLAMTVLLEIFAWPVTLILSGKFNGVSEAQFAFAVELSRYTIPYLMLISVVSLFGGILNSLHKFWVNAAAPILLNLTLIVALLAFHTSDPLQTARVQAIAVSVSGLLQLIWLAWSCRRNGVSLKLRRPRLTPEVKRLLGKQGERFQAVFITVDPERDTPAILREYTQAFDPSFIGLSGDLAQTQTTATDFRVHYAKVPTGSSYTMDHTAGSYVFDPQGHIRLFVKHGQGPQTLAHDIKLLLS